MKAIVEILFEKQAPEDNIRYSSCYRSALQSLVGSKAPH
jgi:hypothetical protein